MDDICYISSVQSSMYFWIKKNSSKKGTEGLQLEECIIAIYCKENVFIYNCFWQWFLVPNHLNIYELFIMSYMNVINTHVLH